MGAAAGSFVWVDDEEAFRKRVLDATTAGRVGGETSLVPVLADGKDELRAIIAEVESEKRPIPQFIILDLDLQDDTYTGIQALRDIRKSKLLTLCPIVIHSRHLGDESVRDSYSHQANSVVQKPGTVKEQSKTILELIKYWSSTNRTIA